MSSYFQYIINVNFYYNTIFYIYFVIFIINDHMLFTTKKNMKINIEFYVFYQIFYIFRKKKKNNYYFNV